MQSASTIATLAGPALVGVVVDAVANDSPNAESTVDRAALAYAVLAIVAAVLRYFGGVRAAVVGEDSLAEMRTEVFDHALAVPVDLVERAGTGDLVSRVTSDITILADAVRNSIPIVLLAVLQVSFTVVALLVLDVRLAGIALITAIPITLAAGQWYFRRAHRLYRRERERHAALGAGLHESYQGAAVLAGSAPGSAHAAGWLAGVGSPSTPRWPRLPRAIACARGSAWRRRCRWWRSWRSAPRSSTTARSRSER